jgi:hypothetical protein
VNGWVRSCAAGDCIQARQWRRGLIELSDTTDPDTRILTTAATWDAFIKAVKDGRFDDLTEK